MEKNNININTVLGPIATSSVKKVLCHEHICCCLDYLNVMAGNAYLDKEKLESHAVNELIRLREKYDLNLFVDCSPINLGRDIELLKSVSRKSGVHIVCSSGFYYTREALLNNLDADVIAEYIVLDAKKVNSGLLKSAVESDNIDAFHEKLLLAIAKAHLKLHLPICVHTDARKRNGAKAAEILINAGVKPECITIAHLSDTDDMNYILSIAKKGCYIGFDRMYDNRTITYINAKTDSILKLCSAGYEDKILLSHDEVFFSGFQVKPDIGKAVIKETPRFHYVFDFILPNLDANLSDKLIRKNPLKMLTRK